MPTPYAKLTTAALNALNSTQLGSLKPYQIAQVADLLKRINWGKANSDAGRGSMSNVANQPTIAQIVTALGANNP